MRRSNMRKEREQARGIARAHLINLLFSFYMIPCIHSLLDPIDAIPAGVSIGVSMGLLM